MRHAEGMWIELTDLADASALADGEDYARRGRVEILSVAPGTVHAVAHGSTTYDVHLHTERWSCTCRVGADGRFCKHLVAAALVASGATGAYQDDRFGTRTDQLEDIATWLATLDPPTLREVLTELARRHPAAVKALEMLQRSRISAPGAGHITKAPPPG